MPGREEVTCVWRKEVERAYGSAFGEETKVCRECPCYVKNGKSSAVLRQKEG